MGLSVRKATDRCARGERWTIVAGVVWCAIAMALCGWSGHLGVFAVGSFMIGMLQAIFSLARQSYLTDVVPIAYRARAMSTLAARMPELGVHEVDHAKGAVSSARVAATMGSTRQTVMPLWADHLALEASVTSLIFGLASGIDMLLFYPAGRVMDQLGRRWVAVPSLVIMGAGLLALPLTQDATTLLLAAMAIGFGNGIGSGMVMTLGADHSPRQGCAHFLGLWRLMSDVGASCGPVLLSLLVAVASLGAGIALTGLTAFLAAGQLAYWIPRAQARARPTQRG
ncbi:MAG: MFS transporter [Betaproteobacteria bacterium]|jgi:MFS family permease